MYVALPAFLSSVHSTQDLVGNILNNFGVVSGDEAIREWKERCPDEPMPDQPRFQKGWDVPLIQKSLSALLLDGSITDRARILAASEAESGAWLLAYPSPHLGTILDQVSLRIAFCLRFGLRICQPHICICGASVGDLGHHGLSCSKSAGRLSRHASINQIIKRSLASANIPSLLEPVGVFRDDGKRPDGITLLPWKQGRALIWDATCADTLAPSHVEGSSQVAGFAAAKAASAKNKKYQQVKLQFEFVAIAVETLGVWSQDAKKFTTDLGKLLIESSGDPRASSFLRQKISLAIQRGNAASVLGTMPLEFIEDIFYL